MNPAFIDNVSLVLQLGLVVYAVLSVIGYQSLFVYAVLALILSCLFPTSDIYGSVYFGEFPTTWRMQVAESRLFFLNDISSINLFYFVSIFLFVICLCVNFKNYHRDLMKRGYNRFSAIMSLLLCLMLVYGCLLPLIISNQSLPYVDSLKYSVREIVILGYAIFLGPWVLSRVRKKNARLRRGALAMATVYFLGCLAPLFIILTQVEGVWIRDFGLPSLVPAQGWNLGVYVLVLVALFSRSWSFFHRCFISLPLMVLVAGSVKESLVIVAAFAILMFVAFFSRQLGLSLMGRSAHSIVICVFSFFLFICFSYAIPILMVRLNMIDNPAIVTREYQLLNYFLYSRESYSWIWGIGWQQAYPIRVEFPFQDLLSGPYYEVTNGYYRFMISFPFVHNVRSVGLIWVAVFPVYITSLMIWLLTKTIRHSGIRNNECWMLSVSFLVVFYLSQFGSGNVESAIIFGLILLPLAWGFVQTEYPRNTPVPISVVIANDP